VSLSRAVDDRGASTSQMGRFETVAMTEECNLRVLADLSGHWIDRARSCRPTKTLILDMDSSVSPTYGEQEGTAYNGHFECTCYHPLFVFNQLGDLGRCELRQGNVHSAHGWREVLEPVVARYRGEERDRFFRGDAAFALPELYEYLEAECFRYAIRLPANTVLQERIAPLLKRPVGRPSKSVTTALRELPVPGADLGQRASRGREGGVASRRAVPARRLHRDEPPSPAIASRRFYDGRGTAEQYIKEGKNAVKWTRLSCTLFKANAVRLQLHALAYNLANFLPTLALPGEVARWSLTSVRDRIVKIGAKVVSHGRYAIFQMAEVAVPRELFRRILARIVKLRPPDLVAC